MAAPDSVPGDETGGDVDSGGDVVVLGVEESPPDHKAPDSR